MRDSQWTKEWC